MCMGVTGWGVNCLGLSVAGTAQFPFLEWFVAVPFPAEARTLLDKHRAGWCSTARVSPLQAVLRLWYQLYERIQRLVGMLLFLQAASRWYPMLNR